MPYIMDLTFHKYEFGKRKNILKDIQFRKLIKTYSTIIHIYIYMYMYIQWDYQNPV